MRHFIALTRFIALYLVLAILPALFGWAVGKIPGLALALVLVAFFLFSMAIFAERLVNVFWGRFRGRASDRPGDRCKSARGELLTGLHQSMRRALQEDGRKLPRLVMVTDPSPNVIVARGLFGSGTIYISQGLLPLLSEGELRVVLYCCVRRCREPDLVVQTLCGVMASFVFHLAPSVWVRSIILGRPVRFETTRRLTPSSLLRFIGFFPVAQLLIYLGGSRDVLSSIQKEEAVAKSTDLNGAMRKLKDSINLWGTGGNPGVVSLFLCSPWAGSNVVSLR